METAKVILFVLVGGIGSIIADNSEIPQNREFPENTENPGFPVNTENPGLPENPENPGFPENPEISEFPCDELITNYCKCKQNESGAMFVYNETYNKYHCHIQELRNNIRSNFEEEIIKLQKGDCRKNLCRYLHNYEDVLISRCEHCILGCEYEPFWKPDVKPQEEDVCAWIVIRGPTLCNQIHDGLHEECDFKKFMEETFFAIIRNCNGKECNVETGNETAL